MENDAIKPAHYKAGKGDVIDFCQNHKLNFSRGSVIKYITRAGKKGDASKELEDLKKAKEFLEREIAILDVVDMKVFDVNYAPKPV